MTPVFITGTGTGIGKTIVSSIVCRALHAHYWKPVQAGYKEGTDSELVCKFIESDRRCFPEVYRLRMPASPHIAARTEGLEIDLELIKKDYKSIASQAPGKYLVIEGAGGLMVPLNSNEFVLDLILALNAKVILVSRNYLGSINHSLLTAAICRQKGIDVIGWIFNDDYLQYQDEIAAWSGYPVIASVPKLDLINSSVVAEQAALLRPDLLQLLEKSNT